MELSYVSLFCICLGLVLTVFTLIYKKKVFLISYVFEILIGILLLMKKVDPTNYNNLVGGVKDFDFILSLISICVLMIAMLEAIYIKSKVVRKAEKMIGYVPQDEKLDYFDLIKYDMAYVNNRGNFVLNKSLRNNLGINNIEISNEELLKFIPDEDKEMLYDNTNNASINFRLKLSSGLEWFEMVKAVIHDDEYTVIFKCDNKKGPSNLIGSEKDLLEMIASLESKGLEYGLILSDIVAIKEYVGISKINILNSSKEIQDKALRDAILVKHIYKILNGFYKDNVRIYKLGNLEYAYLILDRHTYYTIEREIINGSGDFSESLIKLEDKNAVLISKSGLVFSSKLNGVKAMDACYDALEKAIKSKENFNIYSKNND